MHVLSREHVYLYILKSCHVKHSYTVLIIYKNNKVEIRETWLPRDVSGHVDEQISKIAKRVWAKFKPISKMAISERIKN